MLGALDRAFDIAVVPGYSRLGYAARSRDWAALPRLTGRTVLVTGATSGIGRAAAEDAARLGARLVLLARDAGRGDKARREIEVATGNDAVEVVLGDLSSLASVRQAAAAIARLDRVDVLVNNAGVMAPERDLSADGFELTFATNVLGTFVLTNLVEEAHQPSRIITVSSGGMYAQRLDLDDLQTEHQDYDPPGVYARTKRAQVVLTEEWARRFAQHGTVAHSMHPGWAATPGVTTSLPRFAKLMGPILRTPAQGADTVVWLAAADEPGRSTGRFWHDRRPRATHKVPWTKGPQDEGRRLWDALERLSRRP